MTDTEPIAEILCNWRPSHLDIDTIEQEFGELITKLGFTIDTDSNITPSTPEINRLVAVGNMAADWHSDGHEKHHPVALIFWSNLLLPHIRSIETEEIFPTNPGDVVLVWNRKAHHKIPGRVRYMKNRWLVKAWISEMSQIERKPKCR